MGPKGGRLRSKRRSFPSAHPSKRDLEDDGASDSVEANLLDALVSGLQISSQLARNSEKHYGLLSSVFTAQKLHWILTETNTTASAKCCNLIGNLCRSTNLLP